MYRGGWGRGIREWMRGVGRCEEYTKVSDTFV